MNEIDKYTDQLCSVIRSSDEYQRFEKAKSEMQLHAELFEQIDEFRRKCFAVQQNAAQEELPQIMEQLCAEQRKLCSSPVIMDYILTEQEYCAMIRRQYMKLAAVADLELEYIKYEM